MKTTNKAFTLIELLVVVAIAAIIAAIVIPIVITFSKFFFYVFLYFSIPASILGLILKLNQKYKWVVKKRHRKYLHSDDDFDYQLKSGEYLTKDTITNHVLALIFIWPIHIPVFVACVGGKKLYHGFFKNFFSIPEGK